MLRHAIQFALVVIATLVLVPTMPPEKLATAGGPRTAASAYPPHAVHALSGETLAGLPAVTGRIHVDQFGYRPELDKVAVISDPQQGYNAHEDFTPGNRLEVRHRSSGRVVFTGPPLQWSNGAIDETSGDRGWWFDFSAVDTPGEYYVYDPTHELRSPVFRIGVGVYDGVLRAALRTFYYQRLDTPHMPPHAVAPWTDGPAFTQDVRARFIDHKRDPATERDLAGGWMDAGDANKYPTSLPQVIHPLLHAWSAHPASFGDSLDIPESGNGLPDLLDEVRFGLDWLLKMQAEDGGVFIKMGVIDWDNHWPLSRDRRRRYYGPKCSASTLAAASVFAHAARIYSGFPQTQSFSAKLAQRALAAWDWYISNPRSYDCDSGEIKAGSANQDATAHDRMEAFAAAHLWLLTGETSFHDRLARRLHATLQISEGFWSPYHAAMAEVLLDYADHPSADLGLRAKIRSQLAASATDPRLAPVVETALYRAWMVPSAYHWGSNQVRAGYGIAALHIARLEATTESESPRLRQRAADLLHAFHGVNPNGIVYLSNMGDLGAERSLTRIYHERYRHGSPLADHPAPGFLVGGPNQRYRNDAPDELPEYDWIREQPPAKAFADFNDPWPTNSWEITEPSITYQAAYIRLLAAFVEPRP